MDVLVNTPGATPALLEKTMEIPDNIKSMVFDSSSMPNMDGTGDTTITTDKGVELKVEEPDIKEEKSGQEEPKLEVKKEEKITPPPAKKDTEKVAPVKTDDKPKINQISPVKKADKKDDTQDTFDYTKYAPQEVTNMKNMSRQSREAYAKVIEENKTLSQLKDSNYLQHEQGYTLSPEYRQLQTRETEVYSEGKAWENALLAIKKCEKFRQPIDRDRDGRLVFSEPTAPTDVDEIRIAQNLALCTTELGKVRGELNGYGTQFKNRISQDVKDIQAERSNRFAWVSDPKLMDAPVNVNGKEIPVKQIISEFKSLLPVYHRNSIVADVAADLFVALQIQNGLLQEAQKGATISDLKAKEASRAEPTSEDSNRNDGGDKLTIKGKSVPRKFSLEGMPE